MGGMSPFSFQRLRITEWPGFPGISTAVRVTQVAGAKIDHGDELLSKHHRMHKTRMDKMMSSVVLVGPVLGPQLDIGYYYRVQVR